jgi:hypothetical protein
MRRVPRRGIQPILLGGLHDLRGCLSVVLPLSAAASRPGKAGGGARSSSMLKHRAVLGVLGGLAVTLGLLNMWGCAGGFEGSKPVALTITQPVNQTVMVGQTATFSVTASGGPLNYQWYKNGIPISGATSGTYTTQATVMTDSGSVFTDRKSVV